MSRYACLLITRLTMKPHARGAFSALACMDRGPSLGVTQASADSGGDV